MCVFSVLHFCVFGRVCVYDFALFPVSTEFHVALVRFLSLSDFPTAGLCVGGDHWMIGFVCLCVFALPRANRARWGQIEPDTELWPNSLVHSPCFATRIVCGHHHHRHRFERPGGKNVARNHFVLSELLAFLPPSAALNRRAIS